MHRISKKLSYANVTATLALFLTLGGVAWAASTLPSNSVGSAQIIKGAVKGSDIAKNAVTSPKVKNGSLKAADFASGQLPAGPKGDKGDKGDKGAPGATKVTYRSEVQDGIGSGVFAEAEPECEPGETLIGGGGYFVNTGNLAIDVAGTITANGPASGSAASSTPGNWYVAGKNTTAGTRRFFGYAICASP
jgi:hypothetical protein